MSANSPPPPPPAPGELPRQNTQAPIISTPSQTSTSTSHATPYYPYETIGPLTHTHYTRPTTTYWQSIISTSSIPSLPYSTVPPYQYSFPARLTSKTSLLLPIRPLGSTTNGEAVCSLALPHASMTVVRELARIVAEKIKFGGFEPEVVMGLPTGGLVLAPFVAEELGFDRHIPWGYTKKPWYGDNLTTKIECIFDEPGQGPPVYLDPNLMPLIKGKKIALIDDVVSSGSTIGMMLEFLMGGGNGDQTKNEVVSIEETANEMAATEMRSEPVKNENQKGGMGLNIVCVGVGMLQGEKYKSTLRKEVLDMLVGAVESPLLKAVEGGWFPQ